MGALMFLSACTSDIDGGAYVDEKPAFDLKTYFSGPIKAWGIIQDRSGHVRTRFEADMFGKWDGDNGVLTEDFVYYDGTTQHREWHIRPTGSGGYEGSADDIIGKASGRDYGNAIQWTYVMDVPVGDTSYRLNFDDWMWAMNDGVIINRSYMKKFGFRVAELTIFMQKQPYDPS